jgi:hypothetical protein
MNANDPNGDEQEQNAAPVEVINVLSALNDLAEVAEDGDADTGEDDKTDRDVDEKQSSLDDWGGRE